MVRIRGSMSLAVMFKEYPGEIYVARKGQPHDPGSHGRRVLCGFGYAVILKYTRNVILHPEIWHMARLKEGQDYLL